ncbi:MAG: Do family serine endopeptidase [Chlorobi bacterium]|nr:Do family serine endopeptidase [Chlorobiota bacterium]
MNIKKISGSLLLAIVSGVISVWIYTSIFKPVNSPTKIQVVEPKPIQLANLPSEEKPINFDFTYAAEKSINAVVHVMTQIRQEDQGYSNPLYEFFYGPRSNRSEPAPIIGSGSGVIISDDGYIVTNNHVIERSDEIEVVLNDKRSYKAKLVGTDPTTDIALLKIDEKNLPFLKYGDSDNLKVGEWVLAVGNPFNLTSTITAGIVSAKARNINILNNRYAIESFIQTDAVVNRGNSGGALVNLNGDLVGINSAIASSTGYYAGYSFAVPVNIVKKIISDILEFGEVQRAFIGVSIRTVDANLAEEKDLDEVKGVYIESLTDGGAAENAGIEKGDVIVKVGDTKVNSSSELQEQISRYRPGDKVLLTVHRNSKEKDIMVTLRNKEGNTNIVKTETTTVLGATYKEVSSKEKQRLGINNGLKIVELNNGKLRSNGIREGFIIVKVNNKKVDTVKDLKEIIDSITGGIYIEGIYPNGITAYYAFGK